MTIALVIRDHSGVVVVEQVAPFLEDAGATMGRDREGTQMTVEGCMLPILARFAGSPRVVEGGQIVYEFPEPMQVIGRVKVGVEFE